MTLVARSGLDVVLKLTRLSLVAALAVSLGAPAHAQQTPAIEEAPSTVKAVYVEASASRELKPGEKIAKLFTLNNTKPYVLQRLTKRTYWFQRQFYGTTFYVGDRGVLVFDPLEQRVDFIQQAVKEVTNLPITAIVYSHNHSDISAMPRRLWMQRRRPAAASGSSRRKRRPTNKRI